MTDAQIVRWNAIAGTWAEIIWTISWQFCLLGLIAYLLHMSMYRTAPKWRYWLWQVLAIKLLLMPFWTATAPCKWPTASVAPVVQREALVARNSTAHNATLTYEAKPAPIDDVTASAVSTSMRPGSSNSHEIAKPNSSPVGATEPAVRVTNKLPVPQLLSKAAPKPAVTNPDVRPHNEVRHPAHSPSGFKQFVSAAPVMQSGPEAAHEVKTQSEKTTRAEVPPAVSTKSAPPDVARSGSAAPIPATSKTALTGPRLAWQFWLMCAWITCAVWLAVRIVWLGSSLKRRLRASTPAAPDIVNRVRLIAERLGLAHIPTINVVDFEVSPFVCGVIKPRLILPAGLAESFSPEQLDMVLLHELAHVRRNDLVWGWIPELAKLFFFFHPLVHFLYHQIRFERELACDQLALQSSGQDVATYADTLVRVVGQFSCPDSFRMAAAEGPGS